jgi:hypothetical protein
MNETRLHPDDGYAYDGCEGPACRAARDTRPGLAERIDAAFEEARRAYVKHPAEGGDGVDAYVAGALETAQTLARAALASGTGEQGYDDRAGSRPGTSTGLSGLMPARDVSDELELRDASSASAASGTGEPGLDEAWAEAEAALPEGWRIFSVSEPAETRPLDGKRNYWAQAHGPVVKRRCDMDRDHEEYPRENGYGPTPAAALRALAARLANKGADSA